MINFFFQKSLSEECPFFCELPTQLLQGGWDNASNGSHASCASNPSNITNAKKTSASMSCFKRTAKMCKYPKSVLTTSRMQDRGGGAGDDQAKGESPKRRAAERRQRRRRIRQLQCYGIRASNWCSQTRDTWDGCVSSIDWPSLATFSQPFHNVNSLLITH